MNEEKSFKPFISADRVVPEMTVTSIILGILLAVLFGAANAYLGLRVGMTVSASIPAAVISMGILRIFLRRDSILENNMVQTIGSAGESIAAGAIFTMPVLFMWAKEWGAGAPSLVEITVIALCGGILGVLFMVPLRSALIVKEHGTLPYPEGTACSEVLLAGEEGGSKASVVFAGFGISALYKLVTDGFKLFPSEVHFPFTGGKSGVLKGSGVGIDVLPALLGVGYICGVRIAAYMLAGGIISWLVLIPLVAMFGGDAVIYPGGVPISQMGAFDIWGSYIKYIGAGAVAAGGIISLVKSLPLIVKTFRAAMKSYRNKTAGSGLRTEQEMAMPVVVGVIGLTVLVIWLFPAIPVNLAGAVMITVFGFFFVTVSSRLVGLVGSSNNPVSGMAIATLLIATALLKAMGTNGQSGMIAAIAIGSVICIAAAIGGDTSQDLKTGFIVGATPRKQQYGELVGVVTAAITIGFVLYLFDSAWAYGSTELPAPQASLMKMVVEGVMNGNLPWTLVLTGVFVGVVCELLQIPVLPVAVGLYLPIHLSTPIMAGGVLRFYMEKRKTASEMERKEAVDRGVLYTSGMIAGEGIVGVLLAVFAVIPFGGGTLGGKMGTALGIDLGRIGALGFFGLLIMSFFLFAVWLPQKNSQNLK